MRLWCSVLAATLVVSLVPGRALAQGTGESTVYVVSYLDVAFDAEEQVAGLLRQLRDASRKETGNVAFAVVQRTTPSNQFVILETWRDQQARDAHMATPQTRAFQKRLAAHLIAPVDERLCATTAVGPVDAGADAAGTVYVVTHVDVPPTSREAGDTALTTLANASRQEAGNLRFDVVHQPARTNHFTVIEVWRDRASYEAHELAAHTRAFRGQLTPMTGALYDQRWYSLL